MNTNNNKNSWFNQPITICLISTIGIFIITSFYQWNYNRIETNKARNDLVRDVSIELSVRAVVIIRDIERQINQNEEKPEILNIYTANLLSALIQNQESSPIYSLKSCYVNPKYKNFSFYALLCEICKYDDSTELQKLLTIFGSYFYVSQSLKIGEGSKPGIEYLRQLKSQLEFYLPVEYSNRILFPFK